MLQQTLAVFFVLGLLLAALWLLRRQGLAGSNLAGVAARIGFKTGPHRRMQVLQRIALTPQHSLHLVSIDNRLILFAAYPTGCQPVAGAAALNAASDSEGDNPGKHRAAC
jgi:flagellar biogenesis protein FliO